MEIEELRINQYLLVVDTSNYSNSEELPFLGRIETLTNYPTIWVKSLKTNKSYELYLDQIEYATNKNQEENQ